LDIGDELDVPRTTTREQGQATVEFAIVLPLVLLLIAGVIEFGKAFNYWLSLNHLANEGARWAAVNKLPPANSSPTTAEIKDYLLTQVAGQELHDDLSVSGRIKLCRDSDAGIGDEAQVRVQTPYSFPIVSGTANLAAGLFGGSSSFGDITLTGTSTVRLEQVPSWTPDPGCP
jgi:Flp pilus assembly protein TadG